MVESPAPLSSGSRPQALAGNQKSPPSPQQVFDTDIKSPLSKKGYSVQEPETNDANISDDTMKRMVTNKEYYPDIYYRGRPRGTNVIVIEGAKPITDASKIDGFSRDLQQVATRAQKKLGDGYLVDFAVKMCKSSRPGAADQLRGVIIIRPNA